MMRIIPELSIFHFILAQLLESDPCFLACSHKREQHIQEKAQGVRNVEVRTKNEQHHLNGHADQKKRYAPAETVCRPEDHETCQHHIVGIEPVSVS